MNAQELFLDVSTGRFLDGASAVPITRPTIYSDEQKRLRLNLYKVRGVTLTSVTASNDSKIKIRLGTSALKLADGTDVTTAPDNLITAIATVATAPSSQAVGLSRISTYTPVTATLVASVVTYPIVTAGFSATIDYRAPVTATVSVGIGTITLPAFSIQLAPSLSGITDVIRPTIFGKVLSFTSTLNTPDTATFAAVISGGTVTTIAIVNAGLGYIDGTYPLSFSSPSAVTGAVRAIASAVAYQDKIQSITINNAGAEYASAPTVTMFTPAKRVIAVEPTNKISNVVSGSIFSWANGLASSITVGVLFSSPDNLTTPTPTSVPSAFIYFQNGNTWKVQLISSGYGYTTAPTTIHNDALVYDNTVEYRVVTAALNTEGGTAIPQLLIQGDPTKFVLSTVRGITKRPATSSGILISSGGIAPSYQLSENLFDTGNVFGFDATYDLRVPQIYAPYRYFQYQPLGQAEQRARGIQFSNASAAFASYPQL